MLAIQKKITPYNYTALSNKSNEYIVIHYVGSVSSAQNNANYFASQYVGASASYFVDETSIWQSVEDWNGAWHCGGGKQGSGYGTFYNKCKNSNSIGIEMCCKKDGKGNWYIEEATIQNTVELTQYLMQKYNIPIDRVIRHADVTGKVCPEPFCYSTAGDKAWENFKSRVSSSVKDVGYWVEIVNCDSLNVRKGPGTSYEVVTSFKCGVNVWVDGECSNGWLRTNLGSNIGVAYFSGNYTRIINTFQPTPISPDSTVCNMVSDGVTTAENVKHWELVLNGSQAVNPDSLRTILDRYHSKLN